MAGIVDTMKLASALVLAIPAALAGLEFLLVRGQPAVGVTLLVLATGLVVVQRRLTLPTDVPGAVVKRVFGTVAKDPGDGTDREE